jgi:hypothetical protein
MKAARVWLLPGCRGVQRFWEWAAGAGGGQQLGVSLGEVTHDLHAAEILASIHRAKTKTNSLTHH